MVSSKNTLSRGGAVALAIVLAAMGLAIALVALWAPQGSLEAPRWVGVCAGGIFVLGGGALFAGYALAGGPGPDGDLPPGTPFAVRLAQYLMGLAIVASMAAIATWVAFGPGPRSFSSVGPLGSRSPVGQGLGRAVFGIGAVLLYVCFAALAATSLRRLRARK